MKNSEPVRKPKFVTEEEQSLYDPVTLRVLLEIQERIEQNEMRIYNLWKLSEHLIVMILILTLLIQLAVFFIK